LEIPKLRKVVKEEEPEKKKAEEKEERKSVKKTVKKKKESDYELPEIPDYERPQLEKYEKSDFNPLDKVSDDDATTRTNHLSISVPLCLFHSPPNEIRRFLFLFMSFFFSLTLTSMCSRKKCFLLVSFAFSLLTIQPSTPIPSSIYPRSTICT
jgi:hypothetical protein